MCFHDVFSEMAFCVRFSGLYITNWQLLQIRINVGIKLRTSFKTRSFYDLIMTLIMVPLLLVPALALLFFYVSTFRSMCAVPNMAVFCSSLTLWFPGMSLTHFLNDLEMVPVASIITGITLVFTFHMRCISIVRSLYFKYSRLLF